MASAWAGEGPRRNSLVASFVNTVMSFPSRAIGLFGLVLLAAIAGCQATLPPTPPPATGEPAETARPTNARTALPATPSPIATVSELLIEPIILAVGDDMSVSWSPDGRHLLVRNSLVNRPSLEQRMDIIAGDGTVVQSFAGADEGYWVDAERFVLKSYLRLPAGPDPDDPWVFDYVECGGGEPNAVAYVGSLASDELSEVDLPPCSSLPSGYGDVAFVTSPPGDVDCESPCAAFTVWDGASFSEPRLGYPSAWSHDGTMIAVLQTIETRIGISGRPEVLTWPNLDRVASDLDNITGETSPEFDPAGRYLAYNTYGQNKVLELASGEVTDVGSAGSAAAWDDEGNLVTLAPAEETAFAISPTGDVVAHWRQRGNVILGSRDGSTLLVYDIEAESQDGKLSVARAGAVQALTLPGRIDRRPQVAPDGSGFVVEALINGRWSLLLYRLSE